MNESMFLSLRTRMQAARLARLYRKYDHQRTDLNDEAAVVALLRQASEDGRQDISDRYQELLAGLAPEERSWLHGQGLGLPRGEEVSPIDAGVGNENSPARPLMVYRGQIVRR